MSPQFQRLLSGLRHHDATRTSDVFPASRRAEIFAAIIAGEASIVTPEPLTHRGWRRLRDGHDQRRALPRPWRRLPTVAVAAFVACAFAAAVGVVISTSSQAPSARHRTPVIKTMAVSFRTVDTGSDAGYIIATVTDPFAAQSTLNAAFKAAGLDIVVTLVPASPSAVGTVVGTGESANGPQIQALAGGTCVTGGGGPGECPIGVKIPRDFTGQGSITLGRPAQPGEAYASVNSAFAPGESLHCSGLLGEQVSVALPKLKTDNITARWRFVPYNVAATPADTTPPAGNYYITGGEPVSAGVVWFQTSAQPLSAGDTQAADQYNAGC